MSKADQDLVRRRLRESLAAHERMLDKGPEIEAIAAAWIASLRAGGQVLFCGNGGSATDALHLALELSGRFYLDRPALAAHALAASGPALTAIGNDFGFEQVFARQVEAHGRKGDVLVAISTSGNSPNVIRAVEKARSIGLITVALTGAGGGRLAEEADLVLRAPSDDTPRIQECHILIGHLLCELTERDLCAADESK